MTAGAATTPTSVTTKRPAASTESTFPASSRVASSPCLPRYSPRSGTNAWENAPSANRRRSRLGMRKATTKASNARPAPNWLASRISRARPVMRDSSVMPLTEAAALSRFTPGLCFVWTSGVSYQASFRGLAITYSTPTGLEPHHGQHQAGRQARQEIRQAALVQHEPAHDAAQRHQEG